MMTHNLSRENYNDMRVMSVCVLVLLLPIALVAVGMLDLFSRDRKIVVAQKYWVASLVDPMELLVRSWIKL